MKECDTNNDRGSIVDTTKDLFFAELLCIFLCTKVNQNVFTFVCNHDVSKVIRFNEQIKKTAFSMGQRCSIVSSKTIDPSASSSSYIRASPVAAMCYEGNDMFYERVNQADLRRLKEVVENVVGSVRLSSMNRDNGINIEKMFQKILLQLQEIYTKLLKNNNRNIALSKMADLLCNKSLQIEGQDSVHLTKLQEALKGTRNGWMKLFKVIQYFNVSLLFHNENVSFLICDIMTFGNFSLSKNFHLGLIENGSENGTEQNDFANETSCQYYVDFIPESTDVKHEIDRVNRIISNDNLLGDLKRLVVIVCDQFSFSFNDQYLTLIFLMFRSFFQVIHIYTSIVKEPLIFNRDYFNLLNYVLELKLSRGSNKLDKATFMNKNFHFRPNRDERIKVVRKFQMCKVARTYEVNFFRYVQQCLTTIPMTKSDLFVALEKYHTFLKNSGKKFCINLMLRHNEDIRGSKKHNLEGDGAELQVTQLREYFSNYSAKILDCICSDVSKSDEEKFTNDLTDMFELKTTVEGTSQDAQYNFMMRYCASEKMTKKFVEVSIIVTCCVVL